MIAVGERVRTIAYVDRRPQYWVPPGKDGTVITVEEDCIVVQMDQPVEGCDQNQVRFTPENYGMYWWQTRLETVERVYHHHFVFTGERIETHREAEARDR